jgi:iron complex outermembrane receptor protein
LQPEDSRNFTAGVVFTPRFVSGLTISVDIYDIERHDVVRPPDPDAILKREATGKLFPGEQVLRDSSGAIAEIIGPYENNGGETARGIDLGLLYQLQTSLGTFTSQTDVTWLESFRLAQAAGAPALEVAGEGANAALISDDAYLKWKGRSRLEWNWKGFDLSTTATYTDGFHEILDEGPQYPDGKLAHWVSQTWFFDGQLSYHFTEPNPNKHTTPSCSRQLLDDTTLTLGCNDLFGQDPPKAFSSNAGYADFIYDAVGRFVYLSVTKNF